MNLAPIVLFVYNRPWHTRQTLEALMKNELADQSHLFIYCDGPKENATSEDIDRINEVREIVRSKKWCKTIEIIESNINQGLSKSIIDGVTAVVTKYGRIIVLEDDLVTSKWFLKFMNDNLGLYENDNQVASISGYMYSIPKIKRDVFFLRGSDCWGWATWKRSWNLFENDTQKLIEEIVKQNLITEFNYNNSYDYFLMLKNNLNDMNNSWAIRWYASTFLLGKLTLYPKISYVKNIGNDNLGTHQTTNLIEDGEYQNFYIENKKINIKEDKQSQRMITQYFLQKKRRPNLLIKVASKIFSYIFKNRISKKCKNKKRCKS